MKTFNLKDQRLVWVVLAVISAGVVILFITLSGDDTIDGSSTEAYEKSLFGVRNGLTDRDKQSLEEALSLVEQEIERSQPNASPESIGRILRDQLHGLSADEVLTRGVELTARIKKREEEAIQNAAQQQLDAVRLKNLRGLSKMTTQLIASFEGTCDIAGRPAEKFEIHDSRVYLATPPSGSVSQWYGKIARIRTVADPRVIFLETKSSYGRISTAQTIYIKQKSVEKRSEIVNALDEAIRAWREKYAEIVEVNYEGVLNTQDSSYSPEYGY